MSINTLTLNKLQGKIPMGPELECVKKHKKKTTDIYNSAVFFIFENSLNRRAALTAYDIRYFPTKSCLETLVCVRVWENQKYQRASLLRRYSPHP
jgi:hypothetical protein